MLEGLLVDLVPFGERFMKLEHKWVNGPGVFYWAIGNHWLVTHAEMEAWQRERADDPQWQAQRVSFGVQTKDGTPIGLFGMRRWLPHHRLAMLTAMIGEPDYWGGGYGTDALLLLVDFAFEWLDVHKVWLMTFSLNARVIRQMEKVGFTFEGRMREATYAEGARHDILAYGLLREEWPGRAALIEKLGLRAKG
ncbi:MAG TPA: GNAT family protein [Aggregatilineaceae bacterium]|nr:GNAT family protein [Aggregatilineaceae bacterium]